jgi:bifunctional pyridoxal-dependent enzyme with beta-cystathionase and maltose regulon repressor activities
MTGSVLTTRIYTHSNVQQIREAIERRNQLSTTPVEAAKAAYKNGHNFLKQLCEKCRK